MDMWAFGCILGLHTIDNLLSCYDRLTSENCTPFIGEMLLKKVVFAGDSASHQLELIMQTINPPSINRNFQYPFPETGLYVFSLINFLLSLRN